MPPPLHSPIRRWMYVLGAIVVLLLVVIVIAPLIIAHVAKAKLETIVHRELNATLVIGHCSYWPPYTLTLRNASLLARDADGAETSLVSAGKLEIKLASLPGGDKPLRIERLIVHQPVLHLTSPAHRLFDFRNLIRAQALHRNSSRKLSDKFQLSQLDLSGGEIIYKDETLRDLTVKARLDAKNPAEYSYSLTAGAAALRGESSGTLNIDQLLLSAQKGHVALSLAPSRQPDLGLPAIQKQLAEAHVSGDADITGSGLIPLDHPNRSTFSAQLHLSNLRADNPKWPAPLDNLTALLHIARHNQNHPIAIDIGSFRATSGPATLQIMGGKLMADPTRHVWSLTAINGVIEGKQPTTTASRPSQVAELSKRYTVLGRLDFTAEAKGPWPRAGHSSPRITYKILAYARNTSFLIPHMEAPIDRINGGPLLYTDELTRVQNLSAHYEYDMLHVIDGTLSLRDPHAARGISNLNAYITFDRNSAWYPQPIGHYMHLLHPQGTFHATGHCLIYPPGHEPRYDYDLTAASSDASFAFGDDLLPLDHAKLAIVARGDNIELTSLGGRTSGGTVKASAKVMLQHPIVVSGQATFQNIDVRSIYTTLASHGGRVTVRANKHISGHASGDVHIQNTGTDWQTATGNGNVEITRGDFGDVPILTQLASAAHFTDVAFTGSEAAAVFAVSQRTVHVSNIAVSAPAIGVQGDGFIKFDGPLHLRVIIAPLADWRQKLKSTGIPLIGDVAGTAQILLNRATRLLLYEFNVTGNIQHPTITPIPVPILSRTSGDLFSNMLNGKYEDNLLKLLRLKSTTAPK